ncbi:MAG: S41 family peptidase [Bacteroidales bacterium]|nr:S41 family peptidase [Bacteroidales bacterium]
MNNRKTFIVAILMILSLSAMSQRLGNQNKINQTLLYIDRFYVEEIDRDKIMDKGIESMLHELDPHSVYIPAKDVKKSTEALYGNFEGSGIAFQIMKDTINVVEVTKGGPSETVGILAGDKIIRIDDKPAVGDSITNSWVFKKLRGKKGTHVKIEVIRNNKNVIEFDVIRDKIPIKSVDTYFMINKNTGYIALIRFSATSADEVRTAINELKEQGMENLIFDLRGNGGGFMNAAVDICDEFLPEDKLIVYTEGLNQSNEYLKSTEKGSFESGRLVILIDENSASSSEIVSGAIQDHDRGIIIGRRSFGKGLVQRMFPLNDGGQLRITTSRYHTPSGRCIQKPYNDGLEAYYNDIMNRYNNKELIDPDSIRVPDSLKYFTTKKRVVYGGGGIMPDIFVPIDTTRASDYYIEIRGKGLINNFTLEYVNKNREELLKKYPTFEEFDKNYHHLKVEDEFYAYTEKAGIKKNVVKPDWIIQWVSLALKEEIKDTASALNGDTYSEMTKKLLEDPKLFEKVAEKAANEDKKNKEIINKSNTFIEHQIKGLIARNLYGVQYYYEVLRATDEGYKKALEVIENGRLFRKMKITH